MIYSYIYILNIELCLQEVKKSAMPNKKQESVQANMI